MLVFDLPEPRRCRTRRPTSCGSGAARSPARGPVRPGRRAAPVPGRRPARGRARPVRRRPAGGRPARRPRTVRLEPTRPARAGRPTLPLRSDDDDRPSPARTAPRSCPDPDATTRSGARLAAVPAAGRPDLPVGRARGGQDPLRQGLRGRPRRDRHDQLAELHPDGRVRGPAAAVPHRPVPARRRRGRAGRRADRRSPGGRRDRSSSGPTGSARAARPTASTCASTAPATSRARSRCAPATPDLRRYLDAVRMSGSTHDGRRAAILAIDTRDDPGRRRHRLAGRAPRRRSRLGRRLPPRRDAPADDRAVPRRAEHPALAADAGSWSGPARARSPGCASASRRPRAWPTASACRSSASRPPRRCSPRRGGDGRARRTPVLLLPAGPSDRIVVRPGEPPRLLPAGDGAGPGRRARRSSPSTSMVAAPADAVERGEAARAGLGAALIALGAARLRAARRRRPGRARARVRDAAARASARRAGRWHGRATPGEAADRADAARRPAGRPRHRARRASTRRGRPTRTAASSRRTGWRSTWSPASATRSSGTAGCG